MYAVGVDLGGSHYQVAVVEVESGEVLSSLQREVTSQLSWEEGLDNIASDILRLIRELPEHLRASFKGELRVGIAVPGSTSPDGYYCYKCPNLPKWRNVPVAKVTEGKLKRSLRELRLQPEVRVINDVNAAALAEYTYRELLPHSSLMYVAVGTGVGGGIVVGGELLIGTRGLAGEIGHIPVDLSSQAPQCGCGARGCLETHASARAITRKAKERLGAAMTPKELYELVENRGTGWKVGKEIFEEVGYYLGVGIVAVTYVIDLDLVVLGGGVMGAWKYILPGIFKALSERLKMVELVDLESFVVRGHLEHPQVLGAALFSLR